MKHEEGKPRKLWVYNEDTGSVTRKTLIFKVNTVESWYDDPKTFRGHDPYYVDADRYDLVSRVTQSLNRELMETLTAAEKLVKRIKRLTKR